MECCRGCVKDSICLIDSGVDLIIFRSASLDIEHHIADCVVLVSVVVVENVDRSTIEVPVSILRVTGFLMRIDCPVHKIDEFVFVIDNSCCSQT